MGSWGIMWGWAIIEIWLCQLWGRDGGGLRPMNLPLPILSGRSWDINPQSKDWESMKDLLKNFPIPAKFWIFLNKKIKILCSSLNHISFMINSRRDCISIWRKVRRQEFQYLLNNPNVLTTIFLIISCLEIKMLYSKIWLLTTTISRKMFILSFLWHFLLRDATQRNFSNFLKMQRIWKMQFG